MILPMRRQKIPTSMDTNGDGVLDREIYCFCSKCTYYERRTSSHFRTTEPNAC